MEPPLGVPSVWAARTRQPATEDEATVLDPSACLYEDECGICGGLGALEECGCEPSEGACDCDGNTLDALNVCGGTCLEDADGDGICDDDGDECVGEYDACGICNGPGAIYDCGCTGIAPDACDCQGTPDVDQDGICDNVDPCIGSEDSDGDGICDDVDDCDGTYDSCGVCNGPGPIYDCGCSDIPEGDCDCAGNQPDIDGNCQDYAADTDGDGLYDTLLEPCLNQLATAIMVTTMRWSQSEISVGSRKTSAPRSTPMETPFLKFRMRQSGTTRGREPIPCTTVIRPWLRSMDCSTIGLSQQTLAERVRQVGAWPPKGSGMSSSLQ